MADLITSLLKSQATAKLDDEPSGKSLAHGLRAMGRAAGFCSGFSALKTAAPKG